MMQKVHFRLRSVAQKRFSLSSLSERLFLVLSLFLFVVNFSRALYYLHACNRLFIHKKCFSRFYQLILYFKKILNLNI